MHLPTLNAVLNAVAAMFLVAGYLAIRRRNRVVHRRCMLSAFGCSVAFLLSYLLYHYQVGSVAFQGQGAIRTAYFSILLTHTVLAAVVPFLAIATLVLALRDSLDRHRRLARITLPIWLYVSVTGVVVYWMLYRMSFS